MIRYPKELDIIFDTLQTHNAKPIIVGGFVRDFLLNIQSKDIDIEVYGIPSFEQLEKILQVFGNLNSVGKSFGVCKLNFNGLDLDFSLPREDSKIALGHKGFEIQIDSSLSFYEASSRRDFTINAIGYDVLEKKILDPFHGIKDLEHKLLKAVDTKKFVQDPLRVLRAIQFYARFNLRIDSELFTLSKNMIENHLLDQLPKDRIFGEIKKLLLKSKKPSQGFTLLQKLKGFKYLPPIEQLNNKELELIFDSLDSLATQKKVSSKTNLILMMSVLCSQFDSSQTTRFIQNLTDEKEILKIVHSLTQIKLQDTYSDTQLFKLALLVDIELFFTLQKVICIAKESSFFDALIKRAKDLKVLHQRLQPILQGRDIIEYGVQPSQEFSKILSDAYEAQMNFEFDTIDTAKIWLKNYLMT